MDETSARIGVIERKMRLLQGFVFLEAILMAAIVIILYLR